MFIGTFLSIVTLFNSTQNSLTLYEKDNLNLSNINKVRILSNTPIKDVNTKYGECKKINEQAYSCEIQGNNIKGGIVTYKFKERKDGNYSWDFSKSDEEFLSYFDKNQKIANGVSQNNNIKSEKEVSGKDLNNKKTGLSLILILVIMVMTILFTKKYIKRN